MRWTLRTAFWALLISTIAGCAGFPWRGEAPRVSIAGLSFVDANLFEQRYQLTLRIQNPNAFDLRINGIAFDLDVNERPFATGVGNRPVVVPAFGSETFQVEGVSTIGSLLRQIGGSGMTKAGNLRYHLYGRLDVTNFNRRLPFDYRGELDPERLLRRER